MRSIDVNYNPTYGDRHKAKGVQIVFNLDDNGNQIAVRLSWQETLHLMKDLHEKIVDFRKNIDENLVNAIDQITLPPGLDD